MERDIEESLLTVLGITQEALSTWTDEQKSYLSLLSVDVELRNIVQKLNQEQSNSMVSDQVNISGEASKSGATAEQLPQLVSDVMDLPRLQLRGLMAIPAATSDPQRQREPFARLRAILEQLRPRRLVLATKCSSDRSTRA